MNILPMVEDAKILYFPTKGIDVALYAPLLQDKMVDPIRQTNKNTDFSDLSHKLHENGRCLLCVLARQKYCFNVSDFSIWQHLSVSLL